MLAFAAAEESHPGGERNRASAPCLECSFVGAPVVIGGGSTPVSGSMLYRSPLENGLCLQVLAHVILRDEHKAGVRIRRTQESAGDLVQVQLHHWQ